MSYISSERFQSHLLGQTHSQKYQQLPEVGEQPGREQLLLVHYGLFAKVRGLSQHISGTFQPDVIFIRWAHEVKYLRRSTLGAQDHNSFFHCREENLAHKSTCPAMSVLFD